MKLTWLRPQQREEELEAEIRSHLDQAIRGRIERGEAPEEARANALREFGNVGLVKEVTRDMWGARFAEHLIQDVRFGLRMLGRNPGFSLIAILTLALGIGANTSIFSVVNAVLLRPLPYPEPEQLFNVYGGFVKLGASGMATSVPEFTDYQQQLQSFENIGAYDQSSANLTSTDGGEPERLECGNLTPGLFAALGVAPIRGRLFLPEEAQQGRSDVVLLGYALWQRRFAGDEGLIGKQILLNGRSNTVVGVMPPGFAYPQAVELWRPLWFPKEQYDQQRRGARGLFVAGRLKPGVSQAQAQAELDQLAARQIEQYPRNYSPDRGWKISLAPMQEDLVGGVRSALLVLLCAVVFVLLIACANVANLLLARATGRRQELAVRAALGAGRARIVRQLLTESLLLAVLGGVLGMLLARWSLGWLLRLAPDNLPRFGEIGIDVRVLIFTCAVSLLTGVVFGLAPALQAARIDLHVALKEGGRSSTSRRHLSNTFVVAEIALALMLLIGAGLTLKSFLHLQQVAPGFNPDGVLTMRLLLPFESYPQNEQRVAFYQQALERIAALPGVESVGAASLLPMAGGSSSGTVSAENSAVGPNDPVVESEMRIATADYFKTMGIALLDGRAFTEADAAGAPPVAIIDENFARRFYPDENPIGKRIRRGRLDSANPWTTIVGVVRHVRNQRLDIDSLSQVYFPFYQQPGNFNMSLAIRTSVGDPLALSASVRAAIQTVDRNQPVFQVRTLRRIVADSVAPRRLVMQLLGAFAVVAIVLSAIGIYGVVAYAVSQRAHEWGIRLALGARSRDVLRLVLVQGMKLALGGVAIGLMSAWAMTRWLSSVLYNVSATDAGTFAVVALLLAGVALLACWIPARRATRVDPTVALRCE
ncbi:MAG: ABC transporter permease [Acidobacteria bacterium]|nr:ABC transporter permease [Acidobacteriota bacterium]